MLKIVIGIAIIIFSTFAGKNFSKKHIERLKFYSSLSDFNSSLIRDLSFKKDGIISVLKEKYESELFNSYLDKVLTAIKSGEDLPAIPDIFSLEEGKRIKNYFIEAQNYGEEAERDYLVSKREEFKEKIQKLKEYSSKFSLLGSKLGFALGMAVFIIII